MKRNVFFMLVILLATLIPQNIYANEQPWVYLNLLYDGKNHTYSAAPVNIKLNGEIIETGDMPPIILEGRTLVPVRDALESFGATVEWKKETYEIFISYKETVLVMQIDSKTIYKNGEAVTIDIAPKIINSKTMAPIADAIRLLGGEVAWDDSTRSVEITNTDENTIDVGNIVDNNEPPIIIDDNDEQLPANDEQLEETEKPTDVELPEEPPVQSITDSYMKSLEQQKHSLTYITNIGESWGATNESYTITTKNTLSKVSTFLLDDGRLVVDVYNAGLAISNESIEVNSSSVYRIRCSPFQSQPDIISRIVFDLKPSTNYDIYYTQDRTGIVVVFPDAKPFSLGSSTNVTVYNDSGNADRVDQISYSNHTFTIKKNANENIDITKIVENDQYLSLQYDFTFPSAMGNLKINSVTLSDDYIAGYSTLFTSNGFMLKVTEKQILAPIITEDVNNIYIKFVLPKERYPRIVVLDAGHGGAASGTASNNHVEKNLNLGVTLKAYNMLSADGYIKVYATRLTDVNVDNFERAYFANDIADAFVSVHHNSAVDYNPVPSGSEVMYFTHTNESTTQLNSKELAKAFVDNISAAIGTTNRGITNRPNLIVLNQTKIPACLIEVDFVSNPTAAKVLGTEEFQTKVARAIADTLKAQFQKYPTGR